VWIGIGVVGIGILILGHYSPPYLDGLGHVQPQLPEFASEAIKELGMATVIAAILALTFETIRTREFERVARKERERVRRDVFNTTFGHHLPAKVRREVIAQVFQSPFARRHMVLHYFFEPIASDPARRFVRIRVKLSYELHNTTYTNQEFKFYSGLDRPPPGFDLDHEIKMLSVSVRGACHDFTLDERYFASHPSLLVPSPGLLNFELASTGKKIEVPPGHSAMVSTEYVFVGRYEAGHTEIDFGSHVCEMELAVHLSDELRDLYEIEAATTKPDLREARLYHKAEGFYCWDLGPRALLPGQGIDIYWRIPTEEERRQREAEKAQKQHLQRLGPLQRMLHDLNVYPVPKVAEPNGNPVPAPEEGGNRIPQPPVETV